MPLIGGEGGWLLLIIKRAEALRNFTFGWEMKKKLLSTITSIRASSFSSLCGSCIDHQQSFDRLNQVVSKMFSGSPE